MPPFGVRIKLKTIGKGYVSSPFLLLIHWNITVIRFPKYCFALENRGLSTAPDWEEVSFEDMPDKVREKFTGQEADNSDDKERSATVVMSIESDNIYGVIFEYSVDRTRLGGQSISKNPDMTAPLPREKSYVKFSEKGFRTPEELENGTFGIMIEIVLENGEEIPVEYLYEWNAEYGKEYNFTLSGDKNTGFTFKPTDKDIEYEITPWSELPIEFLQ